MPCRQIEPRHAGQQAAKVAEESSKQFFESLNNLDKIASKYDKKNGLGVVVSTSNAPFAIRKKYDKKNGAASSLKPGSTPSSDFECTDKPNKCVFVTVPAWANSTGAETMIA